MAPGGSESLRRIRHETRIIHYSDLVDGDPLTYTWAGPFTEGGGTVRGDMVSVTLPAGVHVISLVVNDGIQDSDPDTVTITAF